ncbi:short chain dehydrogenase family protein [Mycobacteroides abscessus MAB_082312_2258]|nr:short chain dehydrogenase family protein [Mycobacteroides abscessus MAB_082312_2258]
MALITGPTSGLGGGFARKYASLGYDVVLVARDEQRLVALADELTCRFGVHAEALPADLSDTADRARVADRLAAGCRCWSTTPDSQPPGSSGPRRRSCCTHSST